MPDYQNLVLPATSQDSRMKNWKNSSGQKVDDHLYDLLDLLIEAKGCALPSQDSWKYS